MSAYVYFIDKAKQKDLTVPAIPFSKIAEVGAGKYKGEKAMLAARHIDAPELKNYMNRRKCMMDCCDFLKKLPDNSVQLICIDPPWQIGRLNGNSNERVGHPTQKPVEIVERLIKSLSYSGSVVLDFFAGSGTVGRVCVAEGRHCLLCDSDESTRDYFERHLELMRGLGKDTNYTRVEQPRHYGCRKCYEDMTDIMLEVAQTSLKMLGKDLFGQLSMKTDT